MTQGRTHAGGGPGGPHGERGADRVQGTRFRGDMDSERTDGGFLPVDPQDDYRSAQERARSAPGRPDSGMRWSDGRERWNEGTERGAAFGRDRPLGTLDGRGERHPGARRPERFGGEEHREYRAWRDEQMRQLDDEYDAYLTHGHRHNEFSNQFETWLRDKLSGRTDYAGQNDKIGATPVEFGGQNAANSGFTRTDDE